jgi:PucR C-terminal helix-turn-helix domain/Purine catabolism regulatory protein-like family
VRLSALVESSDGALAPIGDVTADPDVTSVATTDLLDPTRYLRGGELVLTGLAWWRADEPERSLAFVASLVRAGAVALAAGEAELGAVPIELAQACARAGLPLLRVPVAYSFTTLTERANRLLTGRDDLAGVLARHRAMLAAAAGRSGLADVLALVGEFVRARCWVLGPAGRLVDGRTDPGLAERTALAHQYVKAPQLPAVVARPGGVVSLFGRRPGWFLVVEADHRNWSEEQRAAIVELTALVALEQDSVLHRAAGEQRLGAALTASDPSTVAEALPACGLDPSRPHVVVVGTGPAALPLLAEALASLPASTRWALGPGAEAVVEGDPIGVLRAFLAAVEPALGPEPVRIGVSDAVIGGPGLLAAAAEARSVLVAGEPGSRVVGPDRLSSHSGLLVAVPADLRRAYQRRVLGPLLEHDAAHRTDLVRTLAAYLECSGSWSRCAAQMHVHVNTLRYRIEKIEALTGRDLRSLSDQVDLLLALAVD